MVSQSDSDNNSNMVFLHTQNHFTLQERTETVKTESALSNYRIFCIVFRLN